jgi:hypothetical protein
MTTSICPNLPKGEPCPKCGAAYVCLFWKTHKKVEQPKPPTN